MSMDNGAGALASVDTARDGQPWVGDGAERPWIGYDDQDVATIVRFVAKSSPTQARAVRSYEGAHADRALVVAATERRLLKLHA